MNNLNAQVLNLNVIFDEVVKDYNFYCNYDIPVKTDYRDWFEEIHRYDEWNGNWHLFTVTFDAVG